MQSDVIHKGDNETQRRSHVRATSARVSRLNLQFLAHDVATFSAAAAAAAAPRAAAAPPRMRNAMENECMESILLEVKSPPARLLSKSKAEIDRFLCNCFGAYRISRSTINHKLLVLSDQFGRRAAREKSNAHTKKSRRTKSSGTSTHTMDRSCSDLLWHIRPIPSEDMCWIMRICWPFTVSFLPQGAAPG